MLLSFGTLAFPIRAEPVAEWKFIKPSENGIVAIENTPANASKASELQGATSVSAEPTGMGPGWQEWLTKGFLAVGTDENGAFAGLVTKATSSDGKDARFSRYLGGSGIRTDKGGTVYLVVSPSEDWQAAKRRGLFGSGHKWEGYISLFVEQGAVTVDVGGMRFGLKESARATAPFNFQKGKWYFVAASWQGGRNPVLFVREMNAQKPASSPAGVVGTFDTVCGILEQPSYDPIALGAWWSNNGSQAKPMDGMGGRMAWAMIDNRRATISEMEVVFQSLISSAGQ